MVLTQHNHCRLSSLCPTLWWFFSVLACVLELQQRVVFLWMPKHIVLVSCVCVCVCFWGRLKCGTNFRCYCMKTAWTAGVELDCNYVVHGTEKCPNIVYRKRLIEYEIKKKKKSIGNTFSVTGLGSRTFASYYFLVTSFSIRSNFWH